MKSRKPARLGTALIPGQKNPAPRSMRMEALEPRLLMTGTHSSFEEAIHSELALLTTQVQDFIDDERTDFEHALDFVGSSETLESLLRTDRDGDGIGSLDEALEGTVDQVKAWIDELIGQGGSSVDLHDVATAIDGKSLTWGELKFEVDATAGDNAGWEELHLGLSLRHDLQENLSSDFLFGSLEDAGINRIDQNGVSDANQTVDYGWDLEASTRFTLQSDLRLRKSTPPLGPTVFEIVGETNELGASFEAKIDEASDRLLRIGFLGIQEIEEAPADHTNPDLLFQATLSGIAGGSVVTTPQLTTTESVDLEFQVSSQIGNLKDTYEITRGADQKWHFDALESALKEFRNVSATAVVGQLQSLQQQLGGMIQSKLFSEIDAGVVKEKIGQIADFVRLIQDALFENTSGPLAKGDKSLATFKTSTGQVQDVLFRTVQEMQECLAAIPHLGTANSNPIRYANKVLEIDIDFGGAFLDRDVDTSFGDAIKSSLASLQSSSSFRLSGEGHLTFTLGIDLQGGNALESTTKLGTLRELVESQENVPTRLQNHPLVRATQQIPVTGVTTGDFSFDLSWNGSALRTIKIPVTASSGMPQTSDNNSIADLVKDINKEIALKTNIDPSLVGFEALLAVKATENQEGGITFVGGVDFKIKGSQSATNGASAQGALSELRIPISGAEQDGAVSIPLADADGFVQSFASNEISVKLDGKRYRFAVEDGGLKAPRTIDGLISRINTGLLEASVEVTPGVFTGSNDLSVKFGLEAFVSSTGKIAFKSNKSLIKSTSAGTPSPYSFTIEKNDSLGFTSDVASQYTVVGSPLLALGRLETPLRIDFAFGASHGPVSIALSVAETQSNTSISNLLSQIRNKMAEAIYTDDTDPDKVVHLDDVLEVSYVGQRLIFQTKKAHDPADPTTLASFSIESTSTGLSQIGLSAGQSNSTKDDFILTLANGQSAVFNLSQRELSDGTKVAIDDNTTVGEVMDEITRQVEDNFGLGKLAVSIDGDHLVLQDMTAAGAGRLQVTSLPGSGITKVLGIEGAGQWHVDPQRHVTVVVAAGTTAAQGQMISINGRSFEISDVLLNTPYPGDGSMTGTGIQFYADPKYDFVVGSQTLVRIGADPEISAKISHVEFEEPRMLLSGETLTGKNLADRFFIKDLLATSELALEVQEKHLSNMDLVLEFASEKVGDVIERGEIEIDHRTYVVMKVDANNTTKKTKLTVRASAALVDEAVGATLVANVAGRTDKIDGKIISKTLDAVDVRGHQFMDLEFANTDKIPANFGVGSVVQLPNDGPWLRVTAHSTSGDGAAKKHQITVRGSAAQLSQAVNAVLSLTTWEKTEKQTDGTMKDFYTTVNATVKAKTMDPDTVVVGARTVTLRVQDAANKVNPAVGQSIHIGGESFRVSAIAADSANPGVKLVTFRTGDKPFSAGKGQSVQFTIGLLSDSHAGTVDKVEGKRQVTLEIAATDDFQPQDVNQYVTIDGNKWRIVRIDVDKELDGRGRTVFRDATNIPIAYDEAGNLTKGGGKEKILAKYLVLETDYETFAYKAGDVLDQADPSDATKRIPKEITAEGVQLGATLGPLGVHLLGSGSLGRRVEFGFTGKITLGDMLDTVLLRNSANGLIVEELDTDAEWNQVFREADPSKGTPAGWNSKIPAHGDTQFHIAIIDREGKGDETLTFEVIGEGLSNKSELASMTVGFKNDDGMPFVDFASSAELPDFNALADQLQNMSLDQLLDAIDEALAQISNFTGSDVYQTEIPGTGKTIGEVLDVIQDVRDVVFDLRKDGGAGTLENIEHRIEKLLGLQDDEFELTLVEEAVAGAPASETHYVLRFDFHLGRDAHEKSSLSFTDGGLISLGGGAELYTEARLEANFAFGIRLSPTTTQTRTLLYDKSSVEATFDVKGEDLKFNLGISGIGPLSKLLQVEGKDGKRSYFLVHGKAAALLQNNWDIPIGAAAAAGSPEASAAKPTLKGDLHLNVGGELPVFIAGTSMGAAKLGIWSEAGNTVLSYDGTNENETKITSTSAFKDFFVKTFKDSEESEAPVTPPAEDRDIENGAVVFDISSVLESVQPYLNGEFNFFELVKLAVDGLDMGLESLQIAAEDALAGGIEVPMLSSTLDGGADFLAALRLRLIEPLREFIHEVDVLDAKTIADYLAQKLGPSGLGLLLDWQGTDGGASRNWGTYLQGVDFAEVALDATKTADVAYKQDNDKAEWGFTLGGTYEVGDNFDLDLGLPGLGLETRGGVGASIRWTLNLGFGISKSQGFYLILPAGDELKLHAEANVENETSLEGRLGFLRLSIEPNDTNVKGQNAVFASADINLDLDNRTGGDLAGELGMGSLSYFRPDVTFAAHAEADLAMKLGIGDDVQSDSPKFPNLYANFQFAWDYTKGEAFVDGIERAGFAGVKFDMGSYVNDVLKPIVDRINAIVEPIRPLVDFLTSPIPVLSDISGESITMLDLAKLYDKNIDVGMIESIADLFKLLDRINQFSEDDLKIDLGEYFFVGSAKPTPLGAGAAGAGAPAAVAHDLALAKRFLTTGSGGKTADEILEIGGALSSSELIGKLTTGAASSFGGLKGAAEKMTPSKKSGKAWAFPIIDDPSQIFGLLLGKDADLVTYDMAPLAFNFTWSQFFPIVGPIGARVTVTLGADIDLAFGYDTAGIRRFIESDYSNYLALVDGFYVSDLQMVNGQPKGKDIAEVSLHGGVSAAAEINLGVGSAGVGGGLGVQVDFNLNDPDRDGKVRLYEMWENVANEWENSDGLAKAKAPLAVFDISGRIYAEFFAYIDTWVWEETWQITDPIEIMTFEVPFQRAPRMAHNETKKGKKDVVVNVGPNSEGRLNGNLADGNESVDIEVSGNTVKVSSRSMGAARQQSFEIGSGGRLYIDAGNGNDNIKIHGQGNFDIEVLGGKGDDTIDLSGYTANAGEVVVIGGAGADTIQGSKSADILVGDEARVRRDESTRKVKSIDVRVAGEGVQADRILANGGEDLVLGGGGSDKLAAGAGNDVVLADGGRVQLDHAELSDLDGVKKTLGGKTWRIGRPELEAGGGDDVVLGEEGADYLLGGTGNDKIDGGAGDDEIFGHRGNDTIYGGSGADTIQGGEGIDIVFGDRPSDASLELTTVFPAAHFSPDLGSTRLQAFTVQDAAPQDSDTGKGNDTILGGQGSDILFGDDGAFSETVASTGGNDAISGGLDNDLITGDAGDDTVSGDYGEDVVYGGEGKDLVRGGEGNDILFGDNGLRGLVGRGSETFVVGNTKIFGVNIANNFGILETTTSRSLGDADTIEAGMGSDWVDGQAGGDRIQIAFRGADQQASINVRDTGSDLGVDSLRILGTFGDDSLLVRGSVSGLGVVALLPEDPKAPADGFPTKTNLERINFWSSVEKVVVDASMGKDTIALDGTVSETIVQGGSGADEIRVGQMFRSARIGTDTDAGQTMPFIAAMDSFDTIETSQGALSKGATGKPVTIQGGLGDDTITILHTDTTLNVFGEEGDDTFQAQAFRTPDQQIILSAPINIDGGLGKDSYAVAGTEGDDKFFITKEGILTEGVSATVRGVESLAAEAGAGDDTFYVLGTNEGTNTVIHGGLGSDTVIHGGLADSVPMQSLDLRGHSGLIQHSIVTDDAEYKNAPAPSVQVNIVDNDLPGGSGSAEAQILFVNQGGTEIVDPTIAFDESNAMDSTKANTFGTYWIQPSKAPLSALTVTVSAPPVSEEVLQAGGRGILVSLDGTSWAESVTLTIAQNADPAAARRQIYVWAPADYLQEGDQNVFLSHSVVSAAGTTLPPMRSVALTVNETTSGVESGSLVLSQSISIPANSAAPFDLGLSSSLNGVKVYWATGKELGTGELEAPAGGTLKVKGAGLTAGGTVIVHWSSNTRVLAGENSVDLAYRQLDDGASLLVKLDGTTLLRRGAPGTRTSAFDWILDGRKILFVSAETGRVMGVRGTVEVTGLSNDLVLQELSTTSTPAEPTGAQLVVEPSNGSLDVVEGGLTDTYTLSLSKKPSKDVTVVIEPIQTVWGPGSGDEAVQVEIVKVDDGQFIDGKWQLTIPAGTDPTKKYTVTVRAIEDANVESDAFSFVAERPEVLDDLDGAVWSEGDGGTSDFAKAGPLLVLHDERGEFKFKSETNEYTDLHAGTLTGEGLLTLAKTELDAALAGVKKDDGTHPTLADLASGNWAVMFMTGVAKDQLEVRTQVKLVSAADSPAVLTLDRSFTLEGAGAVSWRLVKVNPSLFVDELSQVDRVFINDKDATADRGAERLSRLTGASSGEFAADFSSRLDAQRFTSNAVVNSDGLNWGDFELAEVNLGYGVDTLTVSSAQHRDDGFFVATIVNAGHGGDQITVDSYRDSTLNESTDVKATGTLVEKVVPPSGTQRKTFAKVSIVLPAEIRTSEDLPKTLKDGNYFLEMVDAQGGVQRRAIRDIPSLSAQVQFEIDRPFTGSFAGAKVRLVVVPKGTDGVLSINAQDGDDTITATDAQVTGALVLFGGHGGDTIDVASNGYVFGDRGQVVYKGEDRTTMVTLLGTAETVKDGVTILTDDTTPLTVGERQTDGVNRSPVLFRTVEDDVGGSDKITLHGRKNIVFGGNGELDKIDISGGDNIVMGDGGQIAQIALEPVNAKLAWGDGSPTRRDFIETTSDELGGVDFIEIKTEDATENIVMGGQAGDTITSAGGSDILIGDGGRVQYAAKASDPTQARRVYIETKNDHLGGVDIIKGGEGDNVIFGGTDGDTITALSGKDRIVGDGAKLTYNVEEREDKLTNAGRTVAGNDTIDAGTGENIVFGGLGDDTIVTGVKEGEADVRAAHSDDKDEVLGDNGTRTFLGTDDASVKLQTTLSFNFQGAAANGVAVGKYAGDTLFRTTNWNNIAGPLVGIGPSTFGNDPKEIMLNSDGERMQGLELSYGGKENHRTDSLELNGYIQENYDASKIPNPSGVVGGVNDADGWLFAGGVRTSAPNDQFDNKLEVEMDGLSEYFASYTVVVYIDAPNNISTLTTNDTGESIRAVSNGQDTYFIDDSADPNNPKFHNFQGQYIRASESVKNLVDPRTAKGKWANYVVFENMTNDRFVVTIRDGIKNAYYNGRDLPSIAGIQIIGKFHQQDTLASSGTELGGKDVISTSGGEDYVIGGAGNDAIATFGDVRQGVKDFDIVLGDDGRIVEMTRPGRAFSEAVSTQSTSFDAALDLTQTTFDDIIVTGNGNDFVLGGEGRDRIDTERTDDLATSVNAAFGTGDKTVPEALQTTTLAALKDWSNAAVNVVSVNFAYTGRDASIIDADLKVTTGQVAGAVAAKNWNNLIVRDDLSQPQTITQALTTSQGQTVNGMTFGIRTRNTQSGQVSFAMGDHYFGHNEIDADSDNKRMFESYLWAQKQDQVEVDIAGIDKVAGTGAYDVYVYIDGDDQRTAGDDYAFEVMGNGTKYYLNDWQGNTFNGEFRRVDVKTAQAPNVGVTPDGRMVGNYVVFKDVVGSNFQLRIKNFWYKDQAPLSMPSIAAIQIVAGSKEVRDNLPLNGDYDKDVVLGDNGKARFNIDVPYGKNDEANLVAARNKVVEVESNAAMQTTTGGADYIVTGRNNDLVIGGNGNDRIDTGVGGDVILGDQGRVLMTDYDPIGVRAPTNLAILDNQLQDTSTYIGGMNFSAGSFQANNLAGVKLSASTGGKDLIEAGADNDLVYGQEGDDILIGNEGKDDVISDTTGTNIVKDRANAYATETEFRNDLANVLALLDNAGDAVVDSFVKNDFGATTTLGDLAALEAPVTPPTPPTPPGGQTITLPSNADVTITLAAGQEVVLVATDWPGKGNAYWHPDIVLDFNAEYGYVLPSMQVTVDGSTMAAINYGGGGSYTRMNQIPDNPPNGTSYSIRLKANTASKFRVRLANA